MTTVSGKASAVFSQTALLGIHCLARRSLQPFDPILLFPEFSPRGAGVRHHEPLHRPDPHLCLQEWPLLAARELYLYGPAVRKILHRLPGDPHYFTRSPRKSAWKWAPSSNNQHFSGSPSSLARKTAAATWAAMSDVLLFQKAKGICPGLLRLLEQQYQRRQLGQQ